MKKLMMIAIFLLPFFRMANAQTGPEDIISKDNINITILKSVFENSYYEIKETTETYVAFKDGFKIYADLDKDTRYITLSVNWPINETFSTEDKFELLNKLGKDVLLITPYYNDAGTSMIIKTTIWIEGGMKVKNLVFTEKLFVKALNLALDKDLKKIIK
jgi:hypothetical protein